MRWYVSSNGVVSGPFPLEHIVASLRSGAPSNVTVCAEGSGQWLPLSAVPAFAIAIRPAKKSLGCGAIAAIAIGGVFVLGVIVNIAARGTSAALQNTAPSSEASTSKAGHVTKPPPIPADFFAPPIRPNINEEFSLGSYTYNVQRVQVMDEIGHGYGRKAASENAMFIVVSYSIRNDSSQTETVMADDFKIMDASGRMFSPSSDGNVALMLDGKDALLSELQPGIFKKTKTAFEVPSEVLDKTMTLIVPEKGFGGTKEARLTLMQQKP